MTANIRTTALERSLVKTNNDANTRTTTFERSVVKTTNDSQHQNHRLKTGSSTDYQWQPTPEPPP